MRLIKKPLQFKKIDLRDTRSKWTPELVIALIQIIYCLNIPLNGYYVNDKFQSLYSKGILFFGSWPKAITAAGLNYMEIQRQYKWYSRDVIIAEIQRLHKVRVPLTAKKMCKYNKELYLNALKFFGSWPKAVEASGFNYREIRIKVGVRQYERKSKKAVILKWKELKAKGEPLNHAYVDANYKQWVDAAYYYFKGGFPESVEVAGFDYLKECKKIHTKRRLAKISTTKLKNIEKMFTAKGRKR
jgi:hypothetical protein